MELIIHSAEGASTVKETGLLSYISYVNQPSESIDCNTHILYYIIVFFFKYIVVVFFLVLLLVLLLFVFYIYTIMYNNTYN